MAYNHQPRDATTAVIAKAEGLWQSMPVVTLVVQPWIATALQVSR